MASSEMQPGAVLDNRFEILELVNRGGMANIYRARDLRSGATVALKLPLFQFEADPLTFTRFQREEEIGRRLEHPYILKVTVSEGPKSRPYLAMEWVDGRPLHYVLAEKKTLPEAEAARIAGQVCEALEHLRQHQIVHRDLKPENIMICRDGGIRLLDFGIAKDTRARRLTYAGLTTTLGTPDYMAPEQVGGKRGDHRSDIYSLGAILYEMVTGRRLFEGDNAYVVMNARTSGDPVAPRQLHPELSPQIEEIILHALAREPDERFESAAAMAAELADYGKVTLTGRHKRLVAPRLDDSEGWAMRGVLIGALVIIVQLLLFGGLFWYFTRQHRGH